MSDQTRMMEVWIQKHYQYARMLGHKVAEAKATLENDVTHGQRWRKIRRACLYREYTKRLATECGNHADPLLEAEIEVNIRPRLPIPINPDFVTNEMKSKMSAIAFAHSLQRTIA